jgi:hypothetical protein
MSNAHIAILLWGCAGLLAFASLRPHVAALVVALVGFLFLPIPHRIVEGMPWEKREAVGLALLLGAALFDTRTVLRFRPSWIDIPVLCWLLSAPISSLLNNHGYYDAGSALMHRSLQWGAPYFVGAMYLRTHEALRDTIWAVFLSGLAYVPLCLVEVRMSPQFHYWVYGVSQSIFGQTKRGSGYRPMVFMDHGLQVSLWMATAMLAGFGLWWLLRVRRVRGIPIGWLIAAIAVAWGLSKSSGAILLGCLGCAMLFLHPARLLYAAVMGSVLCYLLLRLFGDGVLESVMVEMAGVISAARAESLEFRFTNEDVLLARFWANPWFGSSPWGFNTFDVGGSSDTKWVAVPDSLWIYGLTINGLFGVTALVANLWMPVARGFGLLLGRRAQVAPEVLLCSLLLMLYLLDSMVNGFKTPVYVMIAGGLSRVSPLRTQTPVSSGSDHSSFAANLQPRSKAGGQAIDNKVTPRAEGVDLHSSGLR